MHAPFNPVSSDSLLIINGGISTDSLLPVSLLVHTPHVDVQRRYREQLDDIAYQHSNVGGVIARLLARLEGLWSNDVAYAVSCEEDRAGELLLRVS
jgi:hypothetical protein